MYYYRLKCGFELRTQEKIEFNNKHYCKINGEIKIISDNYILFFQPVKKISFAQEDISISWKTR